VNPALLTHPVGLRESVSTEHGHHPDVPYFPEGGVAAPPDMIVSPRTISPGNGQANELIGPATVDWVRIKDSEEQGVGVPPFKRWPRQFHSEAYNFDVLAIMPHEDQVGPIREELVNRPVKAGWSVPRYGEQYTPALDPGNTAGGGVANLQDPATIAYAIGWGYVGG
jgi:hypothetical protein